MVVMRRDETSGIPILSTMLWAQQAPDLQLDVKAVDANARTVKANVSGNPTIAVGVSLHRITPEQRAGTVRSAPRRPLGMQRCRLHGEQCAQGDDEAEAHQTLPRPL